MKEQQDFSPTQQELFSVIRAQSDIARLGLNIDKIIELATERCMILSEADGAVIELAEGEDMVYRATTGMASSQLGLRIKRQGSLAGLCVETGQTLKCDDAMTDNRVDRAACRKVGLNSMVVIPLQHDKQTVGVLKVLSKRKAAFDETDIELLKMLSEVVASAMFYAAHYNYEEIFYRATHDDLTGLANRSLFLDRLRNSIAQARRENHYTGVMILDMDGLKAINDKEGHKAGDEALIEFARRIKESSRETDTVARFGGDEFAVVLAPLSSREGLQHVAKRVNQRADKPLTYRNQTLTIAASIGSALYPYDGDTVETLMAHADQQMYENKRQRKAAGAG